MALWMSLMVVVNVGPVELDQARITAHLERTEAELRARDVSHLAPEQQKARAENLDALHRYWVRGVYPQNTDAPRMRVPVFIDHGGRACAVGQLMIDSGGETLAQRIALNERLEYLATIETEGVATWVESSGMTFAELAQIQPSYCGCGDEPVDPVCGVDGETYPNPCMATQCAGVEIEHEGPCAGNSESGDGVTEGATTGEDPSSSTVTGGSGGSSTSDSSGSTSAMPGSVASTGGRPDDAPSDTETASGDEAKGCRVGGRMSGAWLPLLMLAWRRRR